MKKHLYLPLIACLSSLVVIPTANAGLSTPKSRDNTSGLVAAQPSQDSIRQIARSITVKVFAGDSRGSGILIAKAGKVYTVLTNAHVVNRGEPYRIQTPDGKIHQALLKNKGDSFRGNDLAVLQFQAKTNYTIATLGDSSALAENREVFAAGFPFEKEQLTFTSGKITLISPKPLVGGYQIGYTNETIQGMSGGPVLNRDGKLIGVVGMGNAILNDGYVYQDGTRPLESTLQQMRQASFAVPIATLAQVAPQFTAMLRAPRMLRKRNARNGESTATTPVYTGVVGEVDKIAQQITVRIDSRNNGNGSGAIVAKRGQTYYVLTASHVVKNEDQYQVVTPDGRQYPVSSATVLEGVDLVDLAVVQFTSTQTYPVATLAKYNVRKDGTWVFVSGFPKSSASQTNQSQRMLTAGTVKPKQSIELSAKDSFSLTNGYELLYTNLSYGGMSGGPVLDKSGRVVGINTAAEDEIEINKEGQPIEINLGYSLGVPIATFVSRATKAKMQPEWLKVETSTPPELTKAENTSISNQLFTLQVPSKDADAFDWLNYGNQLWRVKQLKQAVAAFDRAIQLKPDLYQAYYAKGLALAFDNKYQQALVAFEQANKLDPKFYPAWRWRGQILMNLHKYPEALACVARAIKINDKDFSLYLLRGGTFLNWEHYSDALAAFDQAIKIKPSVLGYSLRGMVYFDLKEYQKGFADLNIAIQLQPDDANAYSVRGIAYTKLKEYQKAIADYNIAIQLQPDDAKAYNNRGIAYGEWKEYQKAFADLNKAIELQPDLALAYNNRGYVYNELKEYQKALADLNKAIELEPDLAIAYSSRGATYTNLKEYQKALADYTKAIELQHDLAESYYNRGYAYTNLKEYQKALADFNKAIELKPDNADAYSHRGRVYGELKEYQKAIADFNKAIELKPDNANAYSGRGYAYTKLKEYQKGFADLNKAIELQPDLAVAYNNRGLAYTELKEYQKAFADLNKAIELQPDLAVAYNNRGLAYTELKEYQKAIAELNKAIALQPDYATAYSNRGGAYTESKEYQKAIVDYTKAIELQPDFAAAYINRGGAYRELKEYQKAIADIQKAAQLFYQQGNMEYYQLAQDFLRSLQSNK